MKIETEPFEINTVSEWAAMDRDMKDGNLIRIEEQDICEGHVPETEPFPHYPGIPVFIYQKLARGGLRVWKVAKDSRGFHR